MFIATPVKVLRRPLESAEYVSIRYTERLAEAGVEPSVGSVGNSSRGAREIFGYLCTSRGSRY